LNDIKEDVKYLNAIDTREKRNLIIERIDQRWIDYIKMDKQLSGSILDGEQGREEKRIRMRQAVNLEMMQLDLLAFKLYRKLSFPVQDRKDIIDIINVIKSHKEQYEKIRFELRNKDKDLDFNQILIASLSKFLSENE
jgi:hypothetical protein